LIKDGIVDPYRLAVGGFSYGGFLTNWLITQTKRFNATLSDAGSIDHTSTWGIMDIPLLWKYLFGGFFMGSTIYIFILWNEDCIIKEYQYNSSHFQMKNTT
jgi:hypothetical protein